MLKLYGYYRSSAAYRVRIALHVKGLDYEHAGVHLLDNGGEQLSPEYVALNPQKLVPTLQRDGLIITQSMTILEYLEECFPETALLPSSAIERAAIRSFSLAIVCEIHPLNNLRVLKYLQTELGLDEEKKHTWYQHWCVTTFAALETQLADRQHPDPFCFGTSPSLADLCLIPQIYNAKRFKIAMDDFPNLMRIYNHCNSLEAFQAAHPDQQPDTVL